MRRLLAACFDLLLPRACARCNGAVANEDALCDACRACIPRLPRLACLLCQTPHRAAGDGRCVACSRQRSSLTQVAAEVPFEGEVAQWVHRFKYPRPGFAGLDPRPGAALVALLRDAARRLDGTQPALVVPVPIHSTRLCARGFHPAGELARALVRAFGWALDPRALVATRATASQTGLDRAARRRNVRGAFAAASTRVRGAHVVLVDDVVTTGATLDECARVLRRAGAVRVAAVCIARTL